MFPRPFFPARYFAPRYWGEGGAEVAPVVPSGSRGRRLVRYVMAAPTIENPVGDWVRMREDDEEFFILM